MHKFSLCLLFPKLHAQLYFLFLFYTHPNSTGVPTGDAALLLSLANGEGKLKAEREWVWGVYFPDYFLAGSSGFAVSLYQRPQSCLGSPLPSTPLHRFFFFFFF